ncbi:MAG: hypothetical protein ACLFWL_07450 [Candidatus Brocadiia bacterium]
MEQPTFARSFEEADGDFYLGLGTDVGREYNEDSYTDTVRPESGTILRVPKSAYSD